MITNNAYPNFEADEQKVAAWQEFLGDIPFETAQENLLQHIRTNQFQPTPADVIGKPVIREGPYIPGVEETRQMLADRERMLSLPGPCPDHLKEQLWNH
jgi:hypothetical protein